MQATCPFSVDKFGAEPPFDTRDDINMARAEVSKTFSGDFVGTGSVQMLSARCPDGGAGYVALERLEGSLHGKMGSFALLHIGTMTADNSWAKWPIVPGSGTGELAGLTGEGSIDVGEDGSHVMVLDYELG